ncbi:MAG TPA: class I SAM-dependent methyltransferase [Xanthomonadaceae bacterium]|nr:class I SAM-dependent methyltransferase [Xanthomonadaceae bacterium]
MGEAVVFRDHFSAVASDYANARPEYPADLFVWIATHAPGRSLAWDAGCGSGQASRGLAAHFDRVHATDPSAAQVAEASGPANVVFAVEPGERCSLPAAVVDVACVAQALHWFERDAWFAECARVLRPGGLLVAWGYQDIDVPPALADANARLQAAIRLYWPPERTLVDEGYAGFDWPFGAVDVPHFDMQADWTLARLLGYFGSYSATKRCREATGEDPVATLAQDFADAWGDPARTQRVSWPLFVHARRKS